MSPWGQALDLARAPYQLYQIEIDGSVQKCDDRVTLQELGLFFKSKPAEITTDALLAFVHDLRARN
jgi:hypothetical protein